VLQTHTRPRAALKGMQQKKNKRHPSKIIVTFTINIRNTFDIIIIESKSVALIIAARGLFTTFDPKFCRL
jgi:hypothetical protein